jgi:1,4-alpha-glucan branching enzyme
MDVVLVLHSHLPYVLHHGRWPHGSDWLCEAAIDSYLPLLEMLYRLREDDILTPLTVGLTPVLANQLADPEFPSILEQYFDQRDSACANAPATLAATGDRHLVPLAAFWARRFKRLRAFFHTLDRDLVAAFASLERSGRIELFGSAATHGLLPLLGKESVALQLGLGRAEHQRLFGRAPGGCWLPECAYQPGLERQVTRAGFSFFWVDAHVARAGQPPEVYGTADAAREVVSPATLEKSQRSPYHAYQVGDRTVLLRDPVSSRQVWSRYEGYPGDAHYLEFHKIRWPEGLRLWRVSAPASDLGDKLPYRPESARARAKHHARHFVSLLQDTARADPTGGAIVAPFDTELFGHWWFEGPEFLGSVFEVLARTRNVRPTTASASLGHSPATENILLEAGSWGARGDLSMWRNAETEWVWTRLGALEENFWRVVRPALADERLHFVLAQAARELLLAQSSDWPFIITTGAARDYAEHRFRKHCEAAEGLIMGLQVPEYIGPATHLAEQLSAHDRLFPHMIPALASALASRPQ